MFKGLRERLAGWKEKADAEVAPATIGDSGRKIKEEKLEEILYDPEMALLESDVAFPVAKEIVDRLADDLKGKRVTRDASLADAVTAALRDAITHVLTVPPIDFFGLIEKGPRPFVVMFVGVNGTGKTTTIAKLAYHIQKKGYTCVVAAADTFRAGAIEGRRPDRHRRPHADEPEPDGPDEEDQTRDEPEPGPVHRRRPRRQRCDRADEAVPRGRRPGRGRPDEARRGRERRRGAFDGEDDRQAGRLREPRADVRGHQAVRREVDGGPTPRGGLA